VTYVYLGGIPLGETWGGVPAEIRSV
jgi:hypothetical protein